MKESSWKDLGWLLLAGLGGLVGAYAMFWVITTVVYELFLEGMLEQTIRAVVKPEYLKESL